MFRRLAALWLVVLIVLPFSAPFPTCDLTDFLGVTPAAHQVQGPVSSTRVQVDESSSLLAPPVACAAGRLKLAALSGLRSLKSVAPAAPTRVDFRDARPSRFGTPPALITTLRI
jgi:hypothetical protein